MKCTHLLNMSVCERVVFHCDGHRSLEIQLVNLYCRMLIYMLESGGVPVHWGQICIVYKGGLSGFSYFNLLHFPMWVFLFCVVPVIVLLVFVIVVVFWWRCLPVTCLSLPCHLLAYDSGYSLLFAILCSRYLPVVVNEFIGACCHCSHIRF